MKKSILVNNKTENEVTLEEYTKNWQVLIDTLPYATILVDTDFHVVMANNAARSLLQYPGKLQNEKCYQLFHKTNAPIENCPVEKTLSSGKDGQTEIYEPSLGKHLIINSAPVIRDENIIGFIHSFLDITKQRENEISSNDLIDIYAGSINELKARQIGAQKGRDAFLNMLEDISESYKELEDLFLKLILVMVNALDAKSPWTKGHSERVSMYAEQIAKQMLIDEDEIKDIKLAGLLHDIGKIGTYDYLLDKPGKLTKEEFDIVKKHPDQGADILKEIKQLRDIIPYIRYHHEKLDGNGYPHKLKGQKIPLGAKILHVADSFDSMTSDRPYRPAPGMKYALSEMEKYKGTQFDPRVIEAFLTVLEKSDNWDPNLSSK
ncbi:MAG: HD domain-containing protein [Nitrospirae bacterium]|nr:HD domain-containing protein [Nitrospirota bacterium]